MRVLLELRTLTCTQRMNHVYDKTVHRGAQHERSRAHQKRHHMEKIRQMANHVKAIVEREHEQIAEQDSDVVPHRVLLECWRR